jgi:polygalacturonase
VLYWAHGQTAVLCGTNLSNVAVVGAGAESSIIDGGGWPWYAAGVKNHSMQGQGPRLFEVAWTRNVTLAHVTFQNAPSWTVHPTYCTGVLAHHIKILNPRFAPNTDGFDPDSSTDVVLHDSTIDTGDDGISIKSGNSSACRGCSHIQVRTGSFSHSRYAKLRHFHARVDDFESPTKYSINMCSMLL